MTLTFDKILIELHRTFPEFKDELTLETLKITADNPSVQFSYFVDFCYKNLNSDHFQKQLTVFLDKLNDSTDNDIKTILCDFVIDLDSHLKSKGVDTDRLTNLFSDKMRKTYQDNVDIWERGNKIK